MTKIKVLTDVEKKQQETVDNIADAITRLSDSVYPLLNGKVKRKTLVVLLAWTSGVPQYQIEKVLEAMENMQKDHLK